MTCVYADCVHDATMRCRFGDGTYTIGSGNQGGPSRQGRPSGPGRLARQTYARYCDPHFQTVAALFHLCDVGPADRPNGPLRARAA